MRIQMLDDEGIVTEECTVHECTGINDQCESAAICEADCGTEGGPDKPVYVWTTAMGMTYFSCKSCLEGESYARLAEDGDAGFTCEHVPNGQACDVDVSCPNFFQEQS